jgi:hypothetical protein
MSSSALMPYAFADVLTLLCDASNKDLQATLYHVTQVIGVFGCIRERHICSESSIKCFGFGVLDPGRSTASQLLLLAKNGPDNP